MWPFTRKGSATEQRGPSEADRAIERARADVRKLEAQAPEVHRLAVFLRERRKENHFGEGLMEILRGQEPK